MKFFNKVRTYMIRDECYGDDEMEIGYEKKFDDLVFILKKDYKFGNSIEVDEGFIIDVDTNNKLVAIEIVNCSDQIGSTKDYVERAKKDVFVEKYEFSYKIIVSFNDGEKEIVKRVLK